MASFMSRTINLKWALGIAIALLVGLSAYTFTCRVTSSDTLLSFLSFASALLSIVLSSFAIFYTHLSNVQVQQQFDKINDAANNINNTAQQLMQIKDDVTATRKTMNELHLLISQQTQNAQHNVLNHTNINSNDTTTL